MLGVGFVNSLGSLSPTAFKGEFIGLSGGNLDKWAIGGDLTGSEGADGFRGFFVGEGSRGAVGILNALRVLALRIVDMGWLGGPMGLSTLKKVDFLPPGDGIGEISDKVSTVRPDKDGRGWRLLTARCGLPCCWSPPRSKSWTLFSSMPVTSWENRLRGGGVVSSSAILAGRLFAWLFVDLVLGFGEEGALFAFEPFLDAGTLFAHSPSGAGAGNRGWPFIDDLDWDDAALDDDDDDALRCLLGDADWAADSILSPAGRAASWKGGILPLNLGTLSSSLMERWCSWKRTLGP
jgi:hypothetical protein